MSLGNAFPLKSNLPDLVQVIGVWTGGGAATNCTKAAADWSRGITSLNYNAATGKYLITFTDVGQQIVSHSIAVCGLTTVDMVSVNLIRGSFSISAKTCEVEFSDLAGILLDLLTTDKILINVTFAKNAP